MNDAGIAMSGDALWIAAAVLAALVGRRWCCSSGTRAGGCRATHVFRASRLSRGNLLFPTQVAVTPTSVVHYTPEFVGGREQSMHIAHVASVLIDRNLFFCGRDDRELAAARARCAATGTARRTRSR